MKSKWLNVSQKDKGNFERIFGVPLKFYFDGVTGFNLTKFEKLFQVPGNMSLQEYIKIMFDEEARKLIEQLIKV